MKRALAVLIAVAVSGCSPSAPKIQATAAHLAAAPDGCEFTAIQQVTSRLEGDPPSGTGVVYANGVTGFGYDIVPAIVVSKPGDRVLLCLVKEPRPSECPPDAVVARTFRAKNYRTDGEWELGETSHAC